MYPRKLPARRWFEHYTSLFDTVELNSTFYRLPKESTVDGWRAAAPPGFVYALKLGAFGTHRMKLRDPGSWLPRHVHVAERLGPTLGPTLVQLPPHWRRDSARLDELLAVAPADHAVGRRARDPSWLHDDVFAVLESHGAALCIHDLLEHHPFVLTTDWTYLRFHGPDAIAHPYHGRYGGRRLWRPARRLAELLHDGPGRLLLLQQRLRGERGRRRAVAGGAAGGRRRRDRRRTPPGRRRATARSPPPAGSPRGPSARGGRQPEPLTRTAHTVLPPGKDATPHSDARRSTMRRPTPPIRPGSTGCSAGSSAPSR